MVNLICALVLDICSYDLFRNVDTIGHVLDVVDFFRSVLYSSTEQLSF